MKEFMVFDLQRFAIHDGPGIRTTVFLKGCPLDCLWCHNPESKRREPQLGFLQKNCMGCGKCQEICQQKVHHIEDDGVDCQDISHWNHRVDYLKCTGCGQCVIECQAQALKLYGKRMTEDEILEIVLKDRDYYERSGGGLTISGGEPMLQFEALLPLVQKAKAKGIHICLDTSGYAPTENYKQIAPYIDLFLFDYKITGEQEHKRYVGVGNSLILENLKSLAEGGSLIDLRCPIIPGINDCDSHYREITRLSNAYSAIRQVNLMMYHDMAKGKARQIGASYALEHLPSMEKEKADQICEKVRNMGCSKLVRV